LGTVIVPAGDGGFTGISKVKSSGPAGGTTGNSQLSPSHDVPEAHPIVTELESSLDAEPLYSSYVLTPYVAFALTEPEVPEPTIPDPTFCRYTELRAFFESHVIT
jgi:hypothetical protein